jgi:predicted metal-dependent HD superfamily phosphohydrolase
MTKSHNGLESDDYDYDLKLFIDLDLSILGRNREEYLTYANNIRQEYIHISDEKYCEKRSEFIKEMLQNTNYIYASIEFRSLFENIARDNMMWECTQLDHKLIPLTL